MTEQDTSEKTENGKVLALLEYGPLVLFFLMYKMWKNNTFVVFDVEYQGFIAATAAFVPLLVLSMLIIKRLTGELSHMQAATLVLVIIFGGMSVWFNDERFFKLKPTLIYLIFASLLGGGLYWGKSFLLYAFKKKHIDALNLSEEGWMILTKRFMFFFIGLAVANEVIWRMMTTDAWVNFKTFGLPLGTIAFFMAQGGLFKRYSTEEDSD